MILNEKYYKELTNKFAIPKDCNKSVEITTAVIWNAYNTHNVYFNFPKGYDLKEITNLLYEKISINIFRNFSNNQTNKISNKLIYKAKIGKNSYKVEITEIGENKFRIKEHQIAGRSSNLDITTSKERLETISFECFSDKLFKYKNYFRSYDNAYLPTYWTKKLVLIAGQTMWNNLKNQKCIPSIYLPNPRENEQTKRKSIEALEDCIAYVTPKYEVCYDEILKKDIEVDTIIVCGIDLNSISQIINDQAKYKFKLIILSNENELQKPNNTTLWNWKKEEIELLEQKNNTKIEVDSIFDKELDARIQHFEECIKYVSSLEYPIKLKDYGYYLRSALNALQEEQFDYLLMRLKNNKELERNEGGYEDFGDDNPKEALKNLISYLKEYNPKLIKLNEIINNVFKKTLIVVDRENLDCFKTIRNRNCQFITQTELKKLIKNGETYTKTILFYTFNGLKDFDFIYHLPNNVKLVLYQQEKDLYYKQLQIHKRLLEEELTSGDRFSICGIKYKPIETEEIKISPTLEQIIERLDQRSHTAYESYKNESDSLLDDLEDEILYRITMSNNEVIELESNETVFDSKGELIKSIRLKIGSKIRIYPKDQLAENLLQIAVDVEPEKFGKIDEHSTYWLNALKELDCQYSNREIMYQELKNKGLKVLPATVDAYFSGRSKFPGFYSDLKIILNEADKGSLFSEVKKSKRLYIGTMQALNRGVKQELQQFLKNKAVGDILQKKNFTVEALQQFINEFMPLLTITKIEEVTDEQQ